MYAYIHYYSAKIATVITGYVHTFIYNSFLWDYFIYKSKQKVFNFLSHIIQEFLQYISHTKRGDWESTQYFHMSAEFDLVNMVISINLTFLCSMFNFTTMHFFPFALTSSCELLSQFPHLSWHVDQI